MLKIKRDKIVGSRRLSNYWWTSIIFFGGLGFLFAGLSSYFNVDIVYFINARSLIFLPQGALMMFYGIIGILVSIFLFYTIILDIGSGYNEFNNDKGIITIFRLGFPGKNRTLLLNYPICEVLSIKIKIKDGINSDQKICLKMKDDREIPLTKIGEPIPLSLLEKQAINLAKFIGVKVEGM
uniref:Photosystem I assembly protein Ycf4 n=1 Tax=Platysiphonia delicata TaxID=2006979 RepID=A0A1Z1M0F7_9FLOR|nr:photosystem I assembly protein [Platysiphonia delicata]ARW59567.1 photosystem I assembly protein [Platysiphonia delicata]